jgi:UDP-N-acetylmuramoyl-L-alanyl-D-glutamate--2,6-diaminopimelate ligase
MRVEEIMAELLVLQSSGLEGQEVLGISFDSRVVQSGDLFVALKGANFDGHDAIQSVVDAGAVVVVGTDVAKLSIAPAWICVAESRRALGIISNTFFQRPGMGMQLIGFTGTNGKTTCTYLLEHGLSACGVVCGVIGTVEARYCETTEKVGFTTPEAPVLCGVLGRMRDCGVDAAITEVSSHGLAMHRVDGLDYAVGIFTNLSQDHLDFHGDMEEYGEAKASFFTRVLPESRNLLGAVLNLDDPWGGRIASRLTYPYLTYGIDEPADVRAEDLRFGIDGVQFSAVGPWGVISVTSQLVGRHNIYNLLATLTTVHLMGEDVLEAAAGLARLGTIPGRLEAVENPFGMGIWVDYCHTPDALEKVLLALREVVPNRLITVIGAGGDRDRSKRPEMGAMAEQFSDLVVVTSDNPRTEDPLSIIEGILSGMSSEFRFEKALVIPNRALAIQAALGIASEGDGILVGGKGHENYQVIGETVHSFDDREVARKAISALEDLSS